MKSRPRGMTLIEMSVVILVLLSLITVIFVGSRAWKAGSDRANCIMNINNVQKGVRGYSYLYDYSPGSTAPDLLNKVIGFGAFVQKTPLCPKQGVYSFGDEYGQDVIPPIGVLYMTCSLSISDDHEPDDFSEW